MAGRVGFEPTVHCCTEVFKTSAINLTRPSTQNIEAVGVEPTLTSLSKMGFNQLNYASVSLL